MQLQMKGTACLIKLDSLDYYMILSHQVALPASTMQAEGWHNVCAAHDTLKVTSSICSSIPGPYTGNVTMLCLLPDGQGSKYDSGHFTAADAIDTKQENGLKAQKWRLTAGTSTK